MMHYPPPEFGFINKEEHAKRQKRYEERIRLALIRYRAWQIKQGQK
jgi:hypothetical protein